MAKQRTIFMEGALKNGMQPQAANELFDRMEKFSGYGFNKSHSAAYAYVAYQTAYLKAHFPAEFMAANMSCVMDFTDKVQQLFEDCKAIGLTVMAPDINAGTYRFKPIDEKTIRYGLGAVKGTGRGAIDNIVSARDKGGAFKDLLDFVRRIDRHVVNRRAIEALIKGGAFDAIEPNRLALMTSLPKAIELAEKADRDAQQVSLFGDAAAGGLDVLTLNAVQPWSERDRLLNEKQALGFYLSGHPFTAYEREIRQIVKTPLIDIKPKNEMLMMAGILYEQRVRNGKRGRMCIITLDDGTARVEAVVYNEVFDRKRAIMVDDQPLIIRGKVTADDFSGGMRVIVDEMLSIDDARRHVRAMTLKMNGQADSDKLRRILSPHLAPNQPNSCAVTIEYNNGVAESTIPLPEAWRVRVSDPLLQSLYDWLTPANVDLRYDTTHMLPPPPPQRNYGGGFQREFGGGSAEY
jgi:DNA polymerase-3 subunit alpha